MSVQLLLWTLYLWWYSLQLALRRIDKVHQRWEAVASILQARKACLHDPSSTLPHTNALEDLMRQSIEEMLSTEMVVCKDDAQTLMGIIGAYGQAFFFKQ